VEGDFRLLSPIDLLQLLAQGRRTGAFLVRAGPLEGGVYLERGRPVHAFFGFREGEKALLEVLALKEGRFLFLLGERAGRTSLGLPLEAYLLQAVRALDERVEVGPFDRIAFGEGVLATHLTLDPEELRLLSHLKGEVSLLDLVDRTGLSLEEAALRVGHLARAGILRVKPRTPHTVRLVVALGEKGASLDALLLQAWRRHYGAFARVRVKGRKEAVLPVEGVQGAGRRFFLAPELLLFHDLRVGEEVLVWPEV
jgi:hypothetical protein